MLQITLTGRGYSVTSAFDGETAIEEIARRSPDLAVIGVRLPRKSGFQVLEAIRGGPQARLPVILISGSPSNEARIQGLRLGADDYLVKPFSPRELLIKIRTILDRAADLRLLTTKTDHLEEEARQVREDLRHSQAEMQQCLERIGSLLGRVEEASGRRELPEILSALALACVRDLHLSRACVLARDAGGTDFVPQAALGLEGRALRGLRLRGDGFVCETLLLEGRTMTADELAAYPSASEDLLALAALGLTHLTPVRRESRELLALIAGGDKEGTEPLDRFDMHLLEVLARSAAMAMAGAELFSQARDAFLQTTSRLVETVESRYPEVAGHSERVTELALALAERMELSEAERTTVAHVARLHDLGSLEQYEHLFGEPRAFTDAERLQLRRLAADGVRRQLERSGMSTVVAGVCGLNERWDGAGMPEGLARETIPRCARLVAVANAFDALTHPRPHRPAYGAREAIVILRSRAGSQFDPAIVALCEEWIAEREGAGDAQSLTMPTTRGPEERSK